MSQIVIDGFVTHLFNGGGTSWEDIRANLIADNVIQAEGSITSDHTTGPNWSCNRSIMQFPTVSLSGEEILSVSIELFVRHQQDTQDVIIHIVDKGTTAGSYPFGVAELPRLGDTSFGNRHFGVDEWENWYSIDLDATVIAYLNLTGNTIFGAREAHDLDDVEPAFNDDVPHHLFWFMEDASTCCRLVVTVQDPVPPEPPAPPTGPIDKTLYLDWTDNAPSTKQNRNWCPNWTTPATSMALSRRADGSLAVLFGTCDGTGRILRLDSSLHNDDGQAIDSFYQTAFGGGPSGRSSWQYLTSSVKGQGTLNMTAIKPDQVTEVGLRDRGLEDEPLGDQEWSGLRVNAERIAWRFGTSALDAWWKMRKLVAYLTPAAWSRTRGN